MAADGDRGVFLLEDFFADIMTSHLRNMHICFIVPGPPFFFLSKHVLHLLQSSMFRHPSHTPHRFRLTYFFLGLVAATGVEEKEGTEEVVNVDVEVDVEVEVPVKINVER